MAIGLFFDTDTGNTRKVAKQIVKMFDDGVVDLINVAKATPDSFDQYTALILGSPTLGDGELPDKWAELLPQLAGKDFSGKTVAMFGLGDQEGYAHEFVDALGLIYEAIKPLGATFIGEWPTSGYEFEKSKAIVGGKFVGLVLDQDNQAELTEDRLETWIAQVKPALLAAAG